MAHTQHGSLIRDPGGSAGTFVGRGALALTGMQCLAGTDPEGRPAMAVELTGITVPNERGESDSVAATFVMTPDDVRGVVIELLRVARSLRRPGPLARLLRRRR